MKSLPLFALSLLVSLTVQSADLPDLLGPKYNTASPAFVAAPPTSRRDGDALHRWNRIAIDASGLDHTPGYRQQLGPGRSSRAMAIVHIAMFECVNAIHPRYQSYINVQKPRGKSSMDAAIAQAARDTLVSLYPLQAATFDAALQSDLAQIHSRKQRENGILLGHNAATAILGMRVGDGSEISEPTIGVDYFPVDLPGHWQQDPISQIQVALGAHWGECHTFVLPSGHPFRAPAPPAMNSSAYTDAYNEAKNYGGDGITTPTQRSANQTFVGIFWAYDGTPSLCAPPRLYNQIAVQIADQRRLKVEELARLLALVNTAMADAGIAVWDSKFFYDLWRPITGIRRSDPGSCAVCPGDGNNNTVGDTTFSPLGAPASNLTGPDFTPPFPSYPSGHAGFGGALFQTLRRFFGTDAISFTFVSDEFNGKTLDNHGNVRPLLPRTFSNLSQAEEENGQSRIYLGIHWSFDKTAGIAQGRQVADYVFDHAFAARH